MYRLDKSLDIELRLSEINRRFAELTATSSTIAGMAEQLGRLRRVNEKIVRFTDHSSRPSSRRRNNDHPSMKPAGNSRRNSRATMVH
jgi:hypothetical protein